MKTTLGLLSLVALSSTAVAIDVPFATLSGGVGIYYNSNTEVPSNQSYYRAQFSQTNDHGSGASLAFPFNAIFGDIGQYGFDFIQAAPTNTGAVPSLPVFENTDNSLAGRMAVSQPVGGYAWALNNYYTAAGPGNPSNDVIHSHLRGTSATFNATHISFIPGVSYTIAIDGTLTADGTYYWYTVGTPDSSMSTPDINGNYLTGNFSFSGTLTYLVATDVTPGMDFYAGDIAVTAEVVPAPAAAALAGLGGLTLLARRRR